MSGTAIIFDTETTRLPKHPSVPLSLQPKIIEFGAIVVDIATRQVLQRYNQLINPHEKIEEKITQITGLQQQDLDGQPSFFEVLPDIRELFKDCRYVFAHNLPFDRSLLSFELQRIAEAEKANVHPLAVLEHYLNWPSGAGEICTVQMFTGVWGRRPKLTELYRWSLGKPLAQTHRASDDAAALYEILMKETVIEDVCK